jgi:hypothetical protein
LLTAKAKQAAPSPCCARCIHTLTASQKC